MRRTASLVVAALAAGILVAPPASATFGAVVDLPATTPYSPFGGPATVTFTFDEADPASVFTIRLRRPGHGTVKEDDVLVDPGAQASPFPVPFGWRDLAVDEPTDYVIDVRPQAGGTVLTSEPFTVLPRLVSGLSASPSPFYPLISDGYRDETTVRFTLAADTVATTAHVYRPNDLGRCCGTEIRNDDLGPRGAGTRRWTWDGLRDDDSPAPKGTWFVRIEATDEGAVTRMSKALKVEIATGWIRETATRAKAGSAYARVGDERITALGGDCNVSRDTGAKTAFVLCANAEISVFWRWSLGTGERIEAASFSIEAGAFGCRTTKGTTKTESYLRVIPTSTCTVTEARITYSYPVRV
jgi:hypothetical protein